MTGPKPPNTTPYRIMSRRSLLRGVAVGGAGLAAAALIGCGDDDGDDSTPAGAATAAGTQSATAAPAPPQAATTAPAQAATTAPAPPTTVRLVIPNDHNLQWMSVWVALGAGFFQEEGLDIQTVFPPSPPVAADFLFMDMADVAVTQNPIFLSLIAEEQPVLVFANLLASEPINLIVRKEVAEERGVSADMPLAERLNGIRGIRVGVAPNAPTRLRVLFDSVGLDADSDIEMVILGGEQQNPAFEEGRVDALFSHTPFLEEALVNQGAVMLVNLSAGEFPELTNRIYHAMTTTRDYADANPDVIVSIARALHRAQQLIHTDVASTVSALLRSGVQGNDPDLLETIVVIYEPAIPRTPEVSVEVVLRQLELFPALLTRPDLSGIDLTKYVEPRFAQEAIGQ